MINVNKKDKKIIEEIKKNVEGICLEKIISQYYKKAKEDSDYKTFTSEIKKKLNNYVLLGVLELKENKYRFKNNKKIEEILISEMKKENKISPFYSFFLTFILTLFFTVVSIFFTVINIQRIGLFFTLSFFIIIIFTEIKIKKSRILYLISIYLFLNIFAGKIKELCGIQINKNLDFDPLIFVISCILHFILFKVFYVINHIINIVNKIYIYLKKAFHLPSTPSSEKIIEYNTKLIKSLYYNLGINIEEEFEKKDTEKSSGQVVKKSLFFCLLLNTIFIFIIYKNNIIESYYSLYYENNNGYCKSLPNNKKIIKDNGKTILNYKESKKYFSSIYRNNDKEIFFYYRKCNEERKNEKW